MTPSHIPPKYSKRLFELLALLAILTLAAFLRLANLGDNPGWYADEGTHLSIAQNLLRGRIQYMAIGQSTLLFSRLPLFEFVLAGSLDTLGGGIGTLRALTGVFGVVSVGLLYWLARSAQGGSSYLPLLSAAALAVYPQAIVYSRFGFSYNLLAPLVLLACLGLLKYLETQARPWLALSAAAIGVGALSDLWMIVMAAPFALAVLARRWRELVWGMPLLALPLGLYAACMLAIAPQAFLFDMRFVLLRLGQLSLAGQVETLLINYATLILQDGWIALALVGLWLLRPARLQRASLLLFLFPLLILGRTTALYSLGFYYMIPLLPFIGLGIASLIQRGAPYIFQITRDGLLALIKHWGHFSHQSTLSASVAGLVVALIVISPLLCSTWLMYNQVRAHLSTAIDPFLINPSDARRVAQFINAQADPADVVIASPALGWQIRANVAEPQMALAAAGQATPLLPANIPPERFVFDPHYDRARFVVIDNLWRNWAAFTLPGMPEMMRQITSWPLVFKSGEIEVYSNPAIKISVLEKRNNGATCHSSGHW